MLFTKSKETSTSKFLFVCLTAIMLTGTTVLGQGVNISGPTSCIINNSYTYTPSYNGSSTYSYNGPYSYTINGGVITGTSNTSKSGTSSGILYSLSINITWTSSGGTLYFTSNLGSKTITITAVTALSPGTLTPLSQSINYGATPSTITGTAATGGASSPSYSYQWMSSSDNSTWSDISGATSQNYSPPALYSSTYFRRKVTETTTSTVGYTSSALVTVYPQVTCTISPSTQNISAGTAASTLTATPSGGTGTFTYQWQYSADNSNWSNVATTSTYNPGVVYTTSYYRAIVTSNGAQGTSNTAIVNTCTAPGGQITGPTQCVVGSTIQLTNPTSGGTWSSSNALVATVNSAGIVTGKKADTVTIIYAITNACGTTYQYLGIKVVPFSALSPTLGSGVADPLITDTISLIASTTKTTQFQQDTLYSQAHSIKNVLALRILEESNKYIPGDFVAAVVVKLEYGHNSTDIYQVDSIKLWVTYSKAPGAKYNAINYFSFDNAEFTRVTVLRVEAPTTVGGVSFDTKQVLQLTNMLAGTRYYKLADNKRPVLSYTNPPGGSIPDALTVNWVLPAHSQNNGLQLEWAWLENELTSSYVVNSVLDTALLFKSSSTRIDLPGGAEAGSYAVPLLYGGAGKLFLRARAVNTMPSGSRSDGPWSWVQSYSFNGHNDSLNWQVTTSYAEEGKRKTVIQYYDGSLRGRQTVTKDNTTGNTVVAETFYDGEGRPAVQILPAPGISSIVSYTKNLNKFNSQPDNANPLDYFDFTTPSLGNYNTYTLDSSTGTSRYYSGQNPDKNVGINKNIPYANGYPFAVTRYTPDATGRILRQGGVGDSLSIGSNHATKYFYGTAEQEQLNALFGTEVGNYTHYFKNMVQDANGQMSVSYVDMHGRTIATALAGDAPTMVQALAIGDTSIYKNQAGKVITRNLLDKGSNILKGNSIESINTVLVPYATQYSFSYQLNSQTLQLPKCGGGTLSYPCKFDLQISIMDESGDSNPTVYNYSGISSINFQQTLPLSAGSYSVRKTLTINQDSLEKFIRQYDSVGVGICQTQQYLIDSIASVDSLASSCNITPVALTSTNCLSSLGTYSSYLLAYANKLGYSNVNQLSASQTNDIRSQYINDSSVCASLNMNISHSLENIREQMLADYVPYQGQYATETGSGTLYGKYNIFANSGNPTYTQPLFKYPRQLTSGTATFYINDWGNVDSTVLLSRLQTMTKEQFKTEFVRAWTKSLLPYHPEYKKLKFAEDTLRSVFNFMDSVQAGVSTAFAPVNADPFFSTFSTGSDKNLMKKYSDTSWQGGYSMWQLAYSEAFGCKAVLDTTTRRTCINNMPKQFTSTGTSVNTGSGSVTLSATLQAKAWTMYKAFYGQVRADMVNKYISLRPGNTDTTENRDLITQGYRLYFPYNNVQQAENYRWTDWYPNQAGVYPTYNVADSAKKAASRCDSYITAWRNALLNCPQLEGHASKEQLLSSITAKLLQVCKNGTDGANPFGSSTVAPAYSGATFTSFEQAVKYVFDSAGISYSQLCHPYNIQYPKPYGKNPLVSKMYVTSLDTCHCSQFYKLQTEVTAAGYYAYSLSSINSYLNTTYGDTISASMYQVLQQCGVPYSYNCRDTNTTCFDHGQWVACVVRKCDTLFARPLASVEPLPIFLSCGFDKSNFNCFTCSNFKTLDSTFYVIFGRHPVFTGTITNDTTIAYNVLFAQYVNFKTGLQHNWQYYADKFNSFSCGIGGVSGTGAGLSICLERTALNDTTGLTVSITPCQDIRNRATVKASLIYEYRRNQALADFRAAYLAQSLMVNEQFKVTDTVKEYHYTLYYYDMAGNLIKTVPPKGVNPIYRQSWLDSVEAAKSTGGYLVPQHSMVTRYSYNSLNQVVIQKTPDAGSSKFFYDRLGRLTLSQNAKQAASGNTYSYTFYDSLGRIVQVGQLVGGSAMTDATAKNEASLQTWFTNAASTRTQITETGYDVEDPLVGGIAIYQKNLRNRVSYTQVVDNAGEIRASGTVYSYDVHGNVDTLVQDFGNRFLKPNPMNQSGNQIKRIVYNYDLVSGKVNQVSYQPDSSDSYYHRYQYDGENRLVNVYTGRDSVMLFFFPERDASYTYYKHGPLAQTELGQLRVQKMDYVYTLQGWIKAVNPVMGGTLANGNDSTEAYPVAQDVFGYSLNYFKNDYKAIGSSPATTGVMAALSSNANPLYNGNISAMVVNIPQLGSPKVYAYKYDQLNRLVAMDAYNGLNVNNGTFTPVGINDYRERVSYDANGNILTYQRNGDAARISMDNMSYYYKANTNQLHKVTDVASDAASVDYSKYNDIKQGQTDNNYQYDQIGNLVSDASENISYITWNNYGRIQTITKSSLQIKYIYDASRNRIFKYTSTDTTVYVRDATGNVLSVYTRTASDALKQNETHLYGNIRLGIKSQLTVTDSSISLSGNFSSDGRRIFTRVEKNYELANYLQNVLVTISDKKTGVDINSDGVIDNNLANINFCSDYFPLGMQMPGRKHSTGSAIRYGFNGKEKADEVSIGDYDYGARIYDGRLGRWLSVDIRFREYPYVSPFVFAFNTPMQATDPDGEKVLWVNGYYNTGKLSDYAGSKSGQAYWSPAFIKRGNLYFNDNTNMFIDGRGKWNSNGKQRFNAGYEYAKANYADLISGMQTDAKGNITETFKVVSHSMGAPYSEGIVKYLEEKGLSVERVVHLSPADNGDFKASTTPKTTQLEYSPDLVLMYKNFDDPYPISGIDDYGQVSTPKGKDWKYNHAFTKDDVSVWDALIDLDNIQFTFQYSEEKAIPDKYDTECGCQTLGTTNYYTPSGSSNGTNFKRVVKGNTPYQNTGKGTYSSGGGVRQVSTSSNKTP